MKVVISVLLALLMPMSVFAITRQEAIEYALDHSEAMRITRESANVLRAAGRQTTSFIRPQLNAAAGHVEMGDNQPDPPFEFLETPDRDIFAEIEAAQVVYAGGRIRRSLDLEKKMIEKADYLETSGERDVVKAVKSAFDAVLYRKAAVEILTDRLAQREAELNDAKDLREVGYATSLDVRQAQLNINFAQNELEEGNALYQEALIGFNIAIGRSGNEDLLTPEGALEDSFDIREIIGHLYDKLTRNDFIDLQSLKVDIAQADLNYNIAAGEALPEVALFTSGKTNGDDIDAMDESWQIGIQLKWDIWDGGLVKAKKEAELANRRKAEENYSQARKSISGDIETIHIKMNSLFQRITLQKEALELSKANYEDARGHYRAGTITMTRLGEFNLSYAEARFNLLGLYYLQRELLVEAEALLHQ